MSSKAIIAHRARIVFEYFIGQWFGCFLKKASVSLKSKSGLLDWIFQPFNSIRHDLNFSIGHRNIRQNARADKMPLQVRAKNIPSVNPKIEAHQLPP